VKYLYFIFRITPTIDKEPYFFYKRLSPVLTNLVLARKQRGCLRLMNCYIGRFLWALPKPASL
ncbi:hypothetical protein, partial [Ruminococcus sp.]|uniref:hypothetical protein n=1 Tax=Ruminococcus sp. TaxID=41978 RepID=UPI00307EF22B